MANRRRRALWMIFGIAFELGLVGIACALGWFFEIRPLAHFSWDLKDAALGVLTSIPLLIAFFVLMGSPVGPFAKLRHRFDEMIRPLFADCTLAELAAISLAAGIGEE